MGPSDSVRGYLSSAESREEANDHAGLTSEPRTRGGSGQNRWGCVQLCPAVWSALCPGIPPHSPPLCLGPPPASPGPDRPGPCLHSDGNHPPRPIDHGSFGPRWKRPLCLVLNDHRSIVSTIGFRLTSSEMLNTCVRFWVINLASLMISTPTRSRRLADPSRGGSQTLGGHWLC